MGDENDRCQRWRKIAIDQLGYLVNLTLGFAIGALGYCFVLLKDKDFTPTDSAKGAMMLSISALVLSAIFGFICAVVRLLDFRGTARRACDHPNKPRKRCVTSITGRGSCFTFSSQLLRREWGHSRSPSSGYMAESFAEARLVEWL
jgi:hypothetical protein